MTDEKTVEVEAAHQAGPAGSRGSRRLKALLPSLSMILAAMLLGTGCAPGDGSSEEGEGSSAAVAAPATGVEMIERSIKFHDPNDVWKSAMIAIDQEATRPNGAGRVDSVTLQDGGDRFGLVSTRDGKVIELNVGPNDAVQERVDGLVPSAELAEKLRLGDEAALRTRNYYVYLFGLPMKLRDPGTIVDPVVREMEHVGREAYEVKVTYDPEVGDDVWYFQFDRETAEMIGYHFYHDEAANKGEYIRLEGLEEVGGLRLPKARTWYRFEGDELLGTDTLHARVSE